MPYRIVKKVKRAKERPIVRSSDYAMNFGVDLDDEKTWKLYPLFFGGSTRILGEVSQLFDASGNKMYDINESHEFDIHCSQYYGSYYGSGFGLIEERFLYLPADLVRGYGIDENMVIDLLLREVIKELGGIAKSTSLYPKILVTGPMDIKPKDHKILHTLSKSEDAVSTKTYDVFICHASEDKETFVRGLAQALSEYLKVWYDEFSLSLGDSLRRKIDYGISHSRYGIVVLSENFFRKDWPQKELDGLVAKEHDFDKVILPIWHGVTREQVASFSPILADRVAVSSDKGMDNVVKEILKAVR